MSLRRLTPRIQPLLHSSSSRIIFRSSAIRFNSTEAAPAPVDPKISAIVDEISKLNLLETSKLVSELKTRLNIPDISFPAAGAVAPAQQSTAAEEETESAAPVQEKTIFTIKLESFDAKSKPKIIKEVKTLLGLSLVDSKKLVESAPKVLKENVTKDDAEKIKETMEAVGGKISLE
jgi:large subunit ribosomal protein L7/L12